MGTWVEKKLSEVCHISIGGTPSRAVSEYWDQDSQTQNFWVSIKDMNQKVIATTSERISTIGVANSNAKLVKKGTVLLSFKLSIGKVSIAGNDLFTNEAIAALEAFGIDNQFLFHGLHKWNLLQDVDQAVKGATLNKEKLKKIKFTIPENKDEQITIATILTALDQAIEKTEQLIAKYERIKTGLMQDLLTRGIDEKGNIRSEETHEFKDSVLGRIPVEWEVTSMKAACERIQDGTHFSPDISEAGEFMYITSKNIRLGELDLRNVDYITREAHESIYRRCSVKFGDVLLTKDGANTGNVCLNTIKEPISLLSSVAFLRGKSGVLSNDFLFQMLSSEKFQKTFKDQMSGNAITRTTLTKINATQIPVPKISEQQRIISVLEKFDCNLSKEKTNWEKYHSMRTALMQDLLTGKVSVDKLLNRQLK